MSNHLPSTVNHSFSRVAGQPIPRSGFDRSWGHKTAYNVGDLIPIMLDPVVPGDSYQVTMQGLARLSTPVLPLMDNLKLETHFFFVPNRIVWDNWTKFMGEKDDPNDSTEYTIPTIDMEGGQFGEQSLGDYFGLPTKVDNLKVSALPFRGYQRIYNEWYRSQDTTAKKAEHKGDTNDKVSDYSVLKRNRYHDYLTSTLPNPLKGSDVGLPLGLSAPIISNGQDPNFIGGDLPANNRLMGTDGPREVKTEYNPSGNPALRFGNETGLLADLTNATAGTINSLREAFAVQQLLELDQRAGTRYVELIKAHYGITVPDFRLQRPEYLGGGRTNMLVTPVPQTSNSGQDTTPQGNLAGFGTVEFNNHSFRSSFAEHGYVIGIASVIYDNTYQQRLDRHWTYETREEHYFPEFAHLGEQAVLKREVMATGTSTDEEVFGYQERWAEMRYKPSQVTGRMRSNSTTPLDKWHLAQYYTQVPALNEDFLKINEDPVKRVVAIQDEPQIIFDTFFDMKCARPLPTYSIPGMDRL